MKEMRTADRIEKDACKECISPSCYLLSSLLMRGSHVDEISKLDWLIGFVKLSMYFLYVLSA
jgi:hypothetical protein